MSQTFPHWIDSYSVPLDDESTARFVQMRLDADQSPRNLDTLREILAAENGHSPWAYGYSIDQARGRFVALAMTEDTSEVIGLAHCFQLEQRGLYFGLVTAVVVLPEYRRRGIGKALLSETGFVLQNTRRVRAARPAQSRAIATIVPARNQRALNFFQHSGYTAMCKGDLYHLNRPLSQ